MENAKITTKEAIFLIVSVLIAHTILSLPNDLLLETKSSILLNIIYITILAILFVLLICKLFKAFPSCDILDVSKFLGGTTLKSIVGITFILYFLITSAVLLRNFCESLITIYYPRTNVLFLILLFIIAITVTNKFKFDSCLKANLLIVPIVLISIIFLFVANVTHFTPERVFPILGKGFFNTFILGISNIFSFSGIVFIYFLPPLLRKPEAFKKISIISVILSGIYLLLVISILLFMFSVFVNINEIMPIFTAARFIEFGTFFQRLESVFLLIWTLSFICYLSIVLKFSTIVFQKIAKLKNRKAIIYPTSLFLLCISLIPKNYAISKFFESNIYKYVSLLIVFALQFLILVLANIKKRQVNSNEKNS